MGRNFAKVTKLARAWPSTSPSPLALPSHSPLTQGAMVKPQSTRSKPRRDQAHPHLEGMPGAGQHFCKGSKTLHLRPLKSRLILQLWSFPSLRRCHLEVFPPSRSNRGRNTATPPLNCQTRKRLIVMNVARYSNVVKTWKNTHYVFSCLTLNSPSTNCLGCSKPFTFPPNKCAYCLQTRIEGSGEGKQVKFCSL